MVLLSSITSEMFCVSEGDVSCFSDYMEMRIHNVRIEGLGLWLSGALKIRGSSF